MDLPLALLLSVGTIALFSFVAVAAWSGNRLAEREAFYKTETLKKLTEMPSGAAPVLEFIREQERIASRRRREGMKLGGLIVSAVGIGIIVFLRALIQEEPIYLAGLIPLFIGVVLLGYAYVLAPKD